MHMLCLLKLSLSSWVFYFFHFSCFFLFTFQLEGIKGIRPMCNLMDSLAVSSLPMSPSKAFLLSITVFLFSSISFWLFLRVSESQLTLLVCSCLLSTFYITAPSILITVILNSLSNNSKICVLWVWFWGWYFSSKCVLFCLLACLVISCWKVDMLY